MWMYNFNIFIKTPILRLSMMKELFKNILKNRIVIKVYDSNFFFQNIIPYRVTDYIYKQMCPISAPKHFTIYTFWKVSCE